MAIKLVMMRVSVDSVREPFYNRDEFGCGHRRFSEYWMALKPQLKPAKFNSKIIIPVYYGMDF